MNFRTAIVGGGPAGLAASLALKRIGFTNVVIYERERDMSARGQGYSLSLKPDGGLPLIEELGLLKEFESISYVPKAFRAFDASNSNPLLEIKSENGRRVERGRLRKFLIDVVNREEIPLLWDHHCIGFETQLDGRVTLKFREKPDVPDWNMVIASDGLHSAIREQIIGDPILYSGFTGFTGLLKRQDNPEIFDHPHVTEAIALIGGRNMTCFFNHQAVSDDIFWSITNIVPKGAIYEEFGTDREKWKNEVEAQSKQFFPLIQELVKSTPHEQFQELLEFHDRDPLQLNASGRFGLGAVTLLGDGAHAMVPFKGAGGNNAFMDVLQLMNVLKPLVNWKDETPSVEISPEILEKTLQVYESEVAKRGGADVLESRENGRRFHSDNSVEIFFRNRILQVVNLWAKFSS
eukprot:TRINITY_DN6858_c0_g1_i1.p1 TRINITY_DN6858_c0_g1~~TRINITY_DN6858_c0_g1_i1.p1  ORF type:complete len:406 (+),score=116.06 TRINITY_DN6858_c0_g1_i1:53-1270(+)